MSARETYPLLEAVLLAMEITGEKPDAFDEELIRALNEIDALRTEIAAANYKLDRVVRRVLG